MIHRYFMLFGLSMLTFSILTSIYEPTEVEIKIDHLFRDVKQLELDMDLIRDRLACLEFQENKAKMHDSIYISENISEDYYV